ncbi:MAG: PQQ-like beta-propeller repeat protein [Acidobacteriota bacterium]|nr:PQQ-like beta-propeller repeat protein [Acidobacteriota bacterium]
MRKVLLTVLAAACGAVVVSADNWPQWRGPDLNGVSAEVGLPRTWSATENIAWKLPMPSRTGATPIIWGDRIFLNVATAEFTGGLELWAVDRTKKTVLWKRPLAGGNKQARKQNMSSPSPVTDGRMVWAMTGVGVLKAFDFAGVEKWSRDIQKEYGAFGLNWEYASSPLLTGGDLIVQVLHGMKTNDPSYVLRIDGATGKTEWKVDRPTAAINESPDSYSTPALVTRGRASEILITGGDVVTGHDPASGKEIWRVDGLNPQNNGAYRIVASPVVWQGTAIIPTRVRPMLTLDVGGRGTGTPKTLWSFDQGPDVPTPVTDGTLVYIVRDNGNAFAVDLKTGATVYGPERLTPGTYSASPVLADGHIYVTNEDGLTSVYKAGPKFEPVAQNALGDYCLSSIAVSQGQLFLRTTGHLWVIGDRRK